MSDPANPTNSIQNPSETSSDSQPFQFQQTIPLQYKIVDLPILPINPLPAPLATFNCKIYRKFIQKTDQSSPADGLTYEWKRKCKGIIKFVQIQNKSIVVAAYQYGTFHNRLRQQPITHQIYYNLSKSLQFQLNWEYCNKNEVISIALLSEQDFGKFGEFWDNAKLTNYAIHQQLNEQEEQEQDDDKNK